MVTADALVETVKRRIHDIPSQFIAFWYQAPPYSRRNFAEEIGRAAAGDETIQIVPLIAEKDFLNANALFADLVNLIDTNRDSFRSLASGSPETRVVMVVLGRSNLQVPPGGSPCRLPEWFPFHAGKEIEIWVDDLSAKVDDLLKSEASRISELQTLLFRFEVSMVKRLEQVSEINQNAGMPLFAAIRDKDNAEMVKLLDFVAAAKQEQSGLNAAGFRPSAAASHTLVGRLLAKTNASSPDQLLDLAKRLRKAVGWPEADRGTVADSIATVLLRSTQHPKDINDGDLAMRNIVVTVFAASQFATASMHSAEYPRYPIVLLQGLSYNLRKTLSDFLVELDSLSRTGNLIAHVT